MPRAQDFCNIVDESGNVVGRVDRNGTVYGLAGMKGMGQFVPWGSFGGDIWEFFNPGRVQDEYRAVGKEPPPMTEIISGAAADATERAAENIHAGVETTLMGAQQITKWVVVGLVAFAIIQGLQAVKGK